MSHTLIIIYLNNVRNNKSKEKRNNHANVKNLCIHWLVVGEWCAEKFVIYGKKQLPVKKSVSRRLPVKIFEISWPISAK